MLTHEITSVAQVKLTPELMAKGFWALSSVEQAEFFNALSREIRAGDEPSGTGCFQWAWMVSDMESIVHQDGMGVLKAMARHALAGELDA